METEAARVGREFEHVGTRKRFPAREENRRHLEGGEIVEHGPALLRRQLALVAAVGGIGVAVLALQVAGPGEVPHDDGTTLRRRLGETHALVFGGSISVMARP